MPEMPHMACSSQNLVGSSNVQNWRATLEHIIKLRSSRISIDEPSTELFGIAPTSQNPQESHFL
jgi:hypothetical protein